MKGRTVEKIAALACALLLTAGVMRGTVLARAEEASGEPEVQDAAFVVMDLDGVADFSGEGLSTPAAATASR